MKTIKQSVARKSVLSIAVLVSVAITSYANTTNQIPYVNDFENIPSGTPLVGSSGWYGASNSYAIVTNRDYSAFYSNYPLPTSTHSNVMLLQTEGTVVTNELEDLTDDETRSNVTNVWFDSVIRFTHWSEDSYPDAITSNDQVQCAFFANTNDHLVVHHYDLLGESNAFTVITNSSITNGQYTRITIKLDYLSDEAFGTIDHTYYQLYIDGNLMTNSAAYQSPSDTSGKPGTWFMTANDAVAKKYLTGLELSGNGVFDDMIVSTNDTMGPTPDSYTIFTEVNDPARGDISPDSDTVFEGNDSDDFAITASNGYYVAQLLTNSVQVFTNSDVTVTSTNYTWPSVMADGTITVNFATSPTYLVTGVVATGQGTIDPATTNVVANNDASFQVDADTGWYIQSITTNETAIPGSPFDVSLTSTNYTWQNVAADGTVTVHFAEWHLITGVVATAGGSVNPASRIVADGQNASFDLVADPHYHVGLLETNGTATGGPWDNSSTNENYVWTSVVADGTLTVAFTENVWTNGTPETWLADYYGSTNYEQAASSDTDGDGQEAWAEHLAGTDPTDSNSVFRIDDTWHENGTNYLRWVSHHVGDQTSLPPYNIVYATNLLNADWNVVTDTVERTDGTHTNVWSWESAEGAFYRIVVTNQ